MKTLQFSLFMALGACSLSTAVQMYPVEGPLSRVVPLPTLTATAEGVGGNTGRLSFVSASGAKCSGTWSSVAPQQISASWGTLFTLYGPATGMSSTVANLPGVNRGEAFAVCGDGTTFDVEFYTGSGTANGYGIARDSRSNVYKLLF